MDVIDLDIFLQAARLNAGQLDQAEKLLSQLASESPEYLEALAECRALLGQTQQAVMTYRQCLEACDASIRVYGKLGQLLIAERQYSGAVALFDEAIDKHPAETMLLFNRGVVHLQANALMEALLDFGHVIELSPGHVEAHVNQGWLLQRQGKLDEAVSHYQTALTLHPNQVFALLNLSNIYLNGGQYEEAADLLARLSTIAPELPGLHINLGVLSEKMGQLEESLRHLNRAIELEPQNAKAHMNRAHVLLRQEKLKEGFPGFEWRLKLNLSAAPFQAVAPQWDGTEKPGQTILVLSEGGFGDTFMFSRYLPWAKARCGQVIFCCQSETRSLYEHCEGYDLLIEPKDLLEQKTVPAHDYYVHLLSLPWMAETTVETIPNTIPYLRTSKETDAAWQQFFNDYKGFKVGLVWSGNDINPDGKNRSCPFEAYEALTSFSQVHFFSLQKGPQALKHIHKTSAFPVIDLDDRLTDFHQTASVIRQLDLVISVDTSVANLAGALGKPVWILLPYASEWRWFKDRPDSPWYPQATLFRQSRPGDWVNILSQVQAQLLQMTKHS